MSPTRKSDVKSHISSHQSGHLDPLTPANSAVVLPLQITELVDDRYMPGSNAEPDQNPNKPRTAPAPVTIFPGKSEKTLMSSTQKSSR